MTILGPCPCHACGAVVTVERRPVVIRGHHNGCRCSQRAVGCVAAESSELTEVVVMDGPATHLCPQRAA